MNGAVPNEALVLQMNLFRRHGGDQTRPWNTTLHAHARGVPVMIHSSIDSNANIPVNKIIIHSNAHRRAIFFLRTIYLLSKWHEDE